MVRTACCKRLQSAVAGNVWCKSLSMTLDFPQKAIVMDRSLFAFIWKHSKREQMVLLAVTLITFPLLYTTLILPKQIINDAIGAEDPMVSFVGVELSQIQFLTALCFAYLAAVLIHGLLKMRLNTMKGVTAERLLRRFRYTLISRTMRFPTRYFRTPHRGNWPA